VIIGVVANCSNRNADLFVSNSILTKKRRMCAQPSGFDQASKFGVRPGWQFLTRQKSNIDRIRHGLGVYDPDDKKIEHMNVLPIGKESTGQWLAIEGLAKPEDIVQTVMSLTPHSGRGIADQAGSRLTNH
jgi:hypothetical protein